MMHIYSYADLYNHYVQEQAGEALDYHYIEAETHKNILLSYSTALYTPNYFIRIALAVLTLVAVLFASLLMGLMFGISGAASMTILLILFSIISYVALEWQVKEKHYYNAGIDNVLMFFSVAFFTGAFATNNYADQWLVISLVSLVLCFWMTLRFTDSFMAILCYVALLASVFLVYIKLGSFAKATAPFVMAAISGFAYYAMTKLLNKERSLFYRLCIKWIMLFSLLSFYTSCNYYVVKETSNAMFHLDSKTATPFGWLFWILTFAIPVAYAVYGIRSKDLMFIRTGLLLSVVSILTYRYYYAVMPVEVAMLTGGCILTAVAYWLTKYLKIARRGFVFDKLKPKTEENIALETILLIEASGKEEVVEPGTHFGGGGFGGGGAGSNY